MPRKSKPAKAAKLSSFESVEKEILKKYPRARKAWLESGPRRQISLMLAGLRKNAGLSQKQLSKLTGWDKAYISRLESARGSIPDLETIARYAQACNVQAGVIFGTQPDAKHVHVVGAVTLQVGAAATSAGKPFERLRDNELKLVAG